MPSAREIGHRVFFLAPPWPQIGAPATLDPEESSHALRVMRVRGGERVRLVDGAGWEGDAVAQDSHSGRLQVRVSARRPCAGEHHLVGRVALPLLRSAARMDWAVEKCTELGAVGFEIYRAQRSVKGLTRGGESKRTRWRRVAKAAMKQSGRALWPQVRIHAGLDAVLADAAAPVLVLADAAGEALVPADLPPGVPHERLLVVGPEGDWTPDELERLVRAGARRVALGPRRLRSETAAAALCAWWITHPKK